MSKYLYCITKELPEASISQTGIEGREVHTVTWRDLSCVVSVTESTHKELNKENAMAHEKVLEEVMQYSAIVPIAFGHVVETDEDIKQKLLETHQNKLYEYLSYFENKVELSLKAFWLNMATVLQSISETSSEIRRIKSKQRITHDDQMRAGEIAVQLLGQTRERMEADMANFFNALIVEYKKNKLFGEQMIANLAFLINKDDMEVFDKKMNEYEEELGDKNIKLKYTGPVPPYNFVDLRFKM
jgi:hypothetical protein